DLSLPQTCDPNHFLPSSNAHRKTCLGYEAPDKIQATVLPKTLMEPVPEQRTRVLLRMNIQAARDENASSILCLSVSRCLKQVDLSRYKLDQSNAPFFSDNSA